MFVLCSVSVFILCCCLSLIACVSFRHLIIENFIPLEEKNKIVNRAYFDEEDEYWKMKPITRIEE